MPDIKIQSITTEKTNIKPGENIIYEVCIENMGDKGDIQLYSGFGYMDTTSTISFIGGGEGHGYWKETIAGVVPGEYFCPSGMVEMPDEALTLQNLGKDIRFYAVAIPGGYMSKDVTVSSVTTTCTQQFRLEDQDGNPVSGSITGEDIYPIITVPASGEVSTTLIKGKVYAVAAFVGALKLEKTFTACTNKITFKFTLIEKCTQQFRLEDQDGNTVSGLLSIAGLDFDVTGNISLLLEKGKEYLARAVVGTVPKQKAFISCTDKIIFQFITAVEHPTLTTSITSPEPYITGTSINLKTVLKSSTGEPISGKQVFFYKQVEYLGGGFTNANGELTLQFQTGITPTTYEIHTAHVTDDNIVIESNRVSFTTEEPTIEPCHQGFRLEDQNGNTISGTITVGGDDHHIPATGEISIQLTEGQNYIAVAKVGTLIKQHSFIACTPQIIFKFTIEEYTPTSLSISIDPTEIGPGQYTNITGQLTIQGKGPDEILPGLPLKLYCDKGTGYQPISTPTTPPSGTGIVVYRYGAQPDDAGKTLEFKYVYEGSDSLKLNPSESTLSNLIVVAEPILIETLTTVAVSPAEIKPGNILTLRSKITEKETGNTLPVGTLVHFYVGPKDLGIFGTIHDGYAYAQFKIPVDYTGSYICKAKYDGIVNKYSSSESTFNINVNPACVEHDNDYVCETSGCHWWTDDTCRGYAEPPPEATGSIGFIIKPNSWYKGNTEQAVVDLTAKTNEIISILTKHFTSIIDIEFVSIDIYNDKNIDRVILKIYYKETGIKVMVAPVALAGMAIGAIASIFVVTAAVGWIESWFADDNSDYPTEVPEDEIIDAGQGGIDDAEDDAAGIVYEIDDAAAEALNNCLDAAETEEDIVECYGLVEIPEENNTDDNAETFGISKWTASLAILYTLCEALEDQVYCDKADELDITLNKALTDFRSGTITKERFILIVTIELNAIDDFLEGKEEEAKEEREEYSTEQCFIVNPGYPITSDNPCIITKTQAVIGGTLIGLSALGLFFISRR